MVRMTVCSFFAKGEYDIWTVFPDNPHHVADERSKVYVLERAVAIVETTNVLNSQMFTGLSQFTLTHLAYRAASRDAGVADLAGVALCKRCDHRFGSGGYVLG
jgi:hypothetical protein